MAKLNLTLNNVTVHAFEICDDSTESMVRRAAASALSMAKYDSLDGFTGAYEVGGVSEGTDGWTVTLAAEGTLRAFLASQREPSLAESLGIVVTHTTY